MFSDEDNLTGSKIMGRQTGGRQQDQTEPPHSILFEAANIQNSLGRGSCCTLW